MNRNCAASSGVISRGRRLPTTLNRPCHQSRATAATSPWSAPPSSSILPSALPNLKALK